MLRVLLLCSVCVRILLVLLGSYEWLGERVEVATPINSWSRRELSVNTTKNAKILRHFVVVQ